MNEALELWGGVECTLNRVGEDYFDQLASGGHDGRLGDLDRFRELGLKTLRFPVLWEKTVASGRPDWSWADSRLARVRELGLRPIVGFLHHGSGPKETGLLDPDLPERLADFAAAFAERHPWVDAYTPVNEPLTTARFSGLYGLWYPHRRDARSFLTMLLLQCRAVAAAMAAVRRVRPDAALVQTEDLGEVSSTPRLAYQAEFENRRRWLSLDVLTGRFGPDHGLWKYAAAEGVPEAFLAAAAAVDCPPELVGINHYVTSNRFLDDRLELHPPERHGGNGRHRYADVEAVRMEEASAAGLADLLLAAWERYRLPLAVTEAHMGCTHDEQLRWLGEVWRTAAGLRARGVPVRAVTAWSLLGAFDWDSLVTRSEGRYESGVFDLRAPEPRPTALAAMVRGLCAEGRYDHPVLDVAGWWRRPGRFLTGRGADRLPEMPAWRPAARRLLITGGAGTLAAAFAHICEGRGLPAERVTRGDAELAERRQVAALLARVRPWAVINAAGYRRIDAAESDGASCRRDNVLGAENLAAACREAGIPLLTFSSDLVFDGRAALPYVEDHPVAPLSVYGSAMAESEARVLAADPEALVVRTGAFFGPWDETNFLTLWLRRLLKGDSICVADDLKLSPTYLPDLVQASLDLLIDGERGIWHLANDGGATWAELAYMAADGRGCARRHVVPRPAAELRLPAPRPSFSVLGSRRGRLMPPLEDALARYFKECRVALC